MFDNRQQRDEARRSSPWAAAEKPAVTALSGQLQRVAADPHAQEQPGATGRFDARQVKDQDLVNLFGQSFGDQKTEAAAPAAAPQLAKPPAPAPAAPVKETTATDLQTEFKNNPRALRSLNTLTADKSYQALTPAQRSALLSEFHGAPNSATTEYLLGMAEYQKGVAADKSGDPQAEKARLEKLTDRKHPDSGSLTLSGTTYTIQDGKLLDKKGQPAGTIDNLGNYQLADQKEPSNYYNNIHARVVLREGEGKDQRTLLSLHDADPNGQLTGPSMNDTFADKAEATIEAMRHEGVDIGAAPLGSFRSFKDQNDLYAKGRTRPGKVVTQARGGESFHNYGVAADLAFYNDQGQITWPETGDYAKLWTRYGERAKEQGLTWGGDWRKPDRPHIEYHPGLNSSQAANLQRAHARGGLEAAWDQLGIGEQPSPQQGR